jgi:acetyl-CoA carboxylase biotin carboxyl carrier protein
MPEKFIVDAESVRGLAKLLDESGLSEIEYQVGTQRIRVVRGSNIQSSMTHIIPSLPPSQPALLPDILPPSESSVPQGETIVSPMVGTVYLSSSPGGAPFFTVGDLVTKGDTLLIIEAMKVMNPIRASRDGKILEICVKDATPVEFGEPLVILA